MDFSSFQRSGGRDKEGMKKNLRDQPLAEDTGPEIFPVMFVTFTFLLLLNFF